ncbi:hypothetical protein [Phytohabitans suffuscus]|uniref:hypothetical protein n=1 Tax=Phytohabitans suffuscus TaxID=624315 RepID=UPI001564C372|nr:hypothetical protein [Phytohabitans suffuscus]
MPRVGCPVTFVRSCEVSAHAGIPAAIASASVMSGAASSTSRALPRIDAAGCHLRYLHREDRSGCPSGVDQRVAVAKVAGDEVGAEPLDCPRPVGRGARTSAGGGLPERVEALCARAGDLAGAGDTRDALLAWLSEVAACAVAIGGLAVALTHDTPSGADPAHDHCAAWAVAGVSPRGCAVRCVAG